MSATATTDVLNAAVQEAAALLGLPASRARMEPVLTTYHDALTSSPIVWNIVNSGGAIKDLSFDFASPTSVGEPYTLAVTHGLAEDVDHRIRALLPDIQARFDVQSYGVDYGVNGGFNKAYVCFPMGALQHLAPLAQVPSMPPALAEHSAAFTAHGLDGKVSAIAIDYTHRTWNVYFNGLTPAHVQRQAVTAMLRDLALPAAGEQMLDFISASQAVYFTFGWDSAKIERISFSVRTTDPTVLPAGIDPAFETFARNAPYTYPGDRTLVFAGAITASEEYYKLAAYYQSITSAHDRFRAAN
ncbi:MAG: hypothetical protein FWE15_13685 [Actinomycetia bacterium]|nr:hypothetical protein [Actinomycetes bacterium]